MWISSWRWKRVLTIQIISHYSIYNQDICESMFISDYPDVNIQNKQSQHLTKVDIVFVQNESHHNAIWYVLTDCVLTN